MALPLVLESSRFTVIFDSNIYWSYHSYGRVPTEVVSCNLQNWQAMSSLPSFSFHPGRTFALSAAYASSTQAGDKSPYHMKAAFYAYAAESQEVSMRRPSRIQSTKSSSRYGHALPLSSKFDRSGFTACRHGCAHCQHQCALLADQCATPVA